MVGSWNVQLTVMDAVLLEFPMEVLPGCKPQLPQPTVLETPIWPFQTSPLLAKIPWEQKWVSSHSNFADTYCSTLA